MEVKFIFYFLLILLYQIPKINLRIVKIKLESSDPNLSEEYHPFRIKFDYNQIEESKSEKLVKNLKNIMDDISKIISQLININNNKLIKVDKGINEICDQRIKYYNKKIKKGISADLLIYPIFGNRKNRKNRRIDGEICAVDSITKRPIIGIIYINQYLRVKSYENYNIPILHHITHILGFSYDIIRKRKSTIRKKLNFYGIKNINEKTFDTWIGTKLKFPNAHYSKLKYDIMSSKKNVRTLFFSAQTLITLQKSGWYQINLSICGCSLKGDCELLRHPIGIYIHKNLNDNYYANCFLNQNVNGKCTILKDTFLPKTKLMKVNENQYNNSFEGNYCLNRLNIWDSSIPKKIKEQTVYLVSPLKNGKCKNPQRTLYFYYPTYLNVTDPEIGKYNIEPYTIKNKEMFVYHSYFRSSAADYHPFYKLMKFHKIPFNPNYYMSNFLSYLFNPEKIKEVVNSLGKYQVFNILFNSNNLGNKLLMYVKYRNLQKLFPEDFQYVPESFILSEDKEILKERFKNYTQTKNDLWIYKPPEGLQGIGIKFMKNGADFLKYSFISRYISNPHLLYNKKYHIRMYVIVTGVLPLKIYIFDEGQVMRAASEYLSELDKIEKLTSMLTNAHQNIGKSGYNPNVTFDTEIGSEWTFKTLSKFIERNGGNWTKMWNEIKDISVKTIISNFNDMQNTYLNNFKHLRSNNIFHRYGFDILFDDKLKPWLLEVNIKPAMELYNKINVRNKIKVETDRLNLMGLIPFNHFTQEPLDKEISYKDDVDEAVQLSLCEFERPHGTLELIFPVKQTLSYYKKFINQPDKYNLALWDYIEKNGN